ncbi:hypothetical protein AB0K14_23675 [Actinosynnema sp. NPDC050801]|uniref:hypothetical protein n=1 Tax=unclassified Actinosynnema TaxID=2637065 RepID=UPI0033E80D10
MLARAVSTPWRLSLIAALIGRQDSSVDPVARLLSATSDEEIGDLLMAHFVRARTARATPGGWRYPERKVDRWLGLIAKHVERRSWGLPCEPFAAHHLEYLVYDRPAKLLFTCFTLSVASVFGLWAFAGEVKPVHVVATVFLLATAWLSAQVEQEHPLPQSVWDNFTDPEHPMNHSPVPPMAEQLQVAAVTGFGLFLASLPLAWLSGWHKALLHGAGVAVAMIVVTVVLTLSGRIGERHKLDFLMFYARLDLLVARDVREGIAWGFGCWGLFFGVSTAVFHGMAAGVAMWSALGLAYTVQHQTTVPRGLITLGWCSFRGASPVRPTRFLDWCCEVGLLRREGNRYEFRHAELRNWLVAREGAR